MTFLDRVVAQFAPGAAVRRLRDRMALQLITARYEGATAGPRGAPGRAIYSDADTAGQRRGVLANIGRDMTRNSPFATRIPQVITNSVVGDGIIPKVMTKQKRARTALMEAVKAHFDTTDIDADGRNNLYGLQRLAMNALVESGEVLLRRRRRLATDGLTVPFQIQVLEADYISDTNDRSLPGGGVIRQGIEYDAIGRRVAYHLYEEHPGASGNYIRSFKKAVRRIDASEIVHLYRVDRPGQSRGVSWLAPVMTTLNDFSDYMDAQIMRQKIAALFAAFRVSADEDREITSDEKAARFQNMAPGRIENLLPGETMTFANPPNVDGLDETTRLALRAAAVGVGITYESLTGDLSQVNFTSGRMGRMEMNANVSAWQWLLLIPQMMMPIGDWFLQAYQLTYGLLPANTGLAWVPPRRIMVDPAREIPALVTEIRAGLTSWSGGVRSMGYDPEELIDEIVRDAQVFDQHNLIFDSDARRTSGAGQAQSKGSGGAAADPNNPDGGMAHGQQ